MKVVVYAPPAIVERLVERRPDLTIAVGRPDATLVETVREVGRDAGFFVIAPRGDADATSAFAARSKRPGQVIIISGLREQGWDDSNSVEKANLSASAESPLKVNALLAAIPSPAAGSDFTAAPPPLPAPAPPSGRTRTSRHRIVERPGSKIIVVTTKKGGVGKSLTALSVAQHIRRFTGADVVLVDANPQQSDSATILNVASTTPTVISLVGVPDLDAALDEVLVPYNEHGGFHVLHGPSRGIEANPDVISPALYATILSSLRRRFDYIIVDTQVAQQYDPFFTDAFLPNADIVLGLTTADTTSLRNLDDWLDYLRTPVAGQGAGFTDRAGTSIGVLITRFRDTGLGDPRAIAEQYLSEHRVIGVIPEDPTWARRVNLGKFGIEADPVMDHVMGGALFQLLGDERLRAPEPGKSASWLNKLFRRTPQSG